MNVHRVRLVILTGVGVGTVLYGLLPAYGRLMNNRPGTPELRLQGRRGTPRQPAPNSYLRGEPIHLTVIVRYPEAADAAHRAMNSGAASPHIPTLRLASSGRSWRESVEVRICRPSTGGWSPVLPGFDWRSTISPLYLQRLSDEADATGMLGARPWEIPLDFPAEITAALPAGRYALYAAFDTRQSPDAAVWHGRVEALPLELELRTPASATEQGRVLAEQARYLVHVQRQLHQGESLAWRAVELAPDDDVAWAALGDACQLQGSSKYLQAIGALERCLEIQRAGASHHTNDSMEGRVLFMRRRLADWD